MCPAGFAPDTLCILTGEHVTGNGRNAMAKKQENNGYRPPKKTWAKDFQKNGVIYLMFLPLMVYYIIFNYIPMVGILMAFENYKVNKGLFGSKWVGMANFVKLFSGDTFAIAMRNTT